MKNVLLIARDTIPSVILCGHAQLSRLAERGVIGYRMVSPLLCAAADLRWADVLVFVRADDDVSLALARTAREAGRSTVYVLDDDLLCAPAGLESSAHYARAETKELIRSIMAQCGWFLSPSPALLGKYGNLFARTERIEEPALASRAGEERTEDGVIRIGFAGSVDRAGDIDTILTGALRRLHERYGNRITVTFFGAKPALADEPWAEHIPYRESYEVYRETMAALDWDIGLAPMPETPFHRCKHYNKYIEYAAHGIAGIYSDAEPYRRAVRSGENGLLAGNTEDAWFAALCRLVEDAPLRHHLAETARREAETVYALDTVSEAWERLIAEMVTERRETAGLRSFDRERRRQRRQWVWRKLRAWGWRAPFLAARKLWRKLFS